MFCPHMKLVQGLFLDEQACPDFELLFPIVTDLSSRHNSPKNTQLTGEHPRGVGSRLIIQKFTCFEGISVESNELTYLSPAQAAQRLGVTKETIRAYIAKGKLAAKKLPGGSYRISVTDLEKMLATVEQRA
jgi:excisionase family DNA binding protein